MLIPLRLFVHLRFLDQGTSIIIEDGAFLRAKGAHFYACDTMWRGIQLMPNATFSAKESTIEDAQYAVQTSDGASLNLRDNRFLNNYIGVYHPPSATGTFTMIACRENIFETNNEGLFPPYQGQSPLPGNSTHAGIEFHGVNLVDIGQENNTKINQFRDIDNGIILRNSNVSVFESTFTNINSYGIDAIGLGHSLRQRGLGNVRGQSTLSFQNCRRAIHAEGIDTDIADNGRCFDRSRSLGWTR